MVVINMRAPAPKEFYIRKKDVEAHGITRDCAGCRTMFHGGTRQNHSAECRERFRTLLQDDSRVQRMADKRKEFEEKAAADEQRRQDKRQRKAERKANRKRAAEDDDLDAERLARDAPAEGEGEDSRPAPAPEPEQPGAEGRFSVEGGAGDADMGGEGKNSGDGGTGGMDVEAILHGDAYWDDVRGGWLDEARVREARLEEVTFMQKEHLWDVVPREQAAGHRVVSVRWVDTNKGTADRPDVRSRLVARDFNAGVDRDREDLFAATPPWELKRLLLSHAADRRGRGTRKVMLIDVKKAHLYPLCATDTYIELPDEVGAGPGFVGKLRRMLYGLRSAAATWENHYASNLEQIGFARGVSTPVSFYHAGRGISLVVHGDDFTFVGYEKDLQWVAACMKKWYQLKVRACLGPDAADDKEAVLLGRVIRWHAWGISCEADSKYRLRIMAALGLGESSKSLASPGIKDEGAAAEVVGEWPGEDKEYRAIVATVNYLASDQPDLQYASKEACRDMAAPDKAAWMKLKRIGRYLVGRKQVVWRFPWRAEAAAWTVTVDSDWAGDRCTRKSTSGGIIRLGPHTLKTWSSTQSSPALSSCEAEYYALVDGATRALGLQAAAKELGVAVEDVIVETVTDSSAAKSYASRRGAGRIRHIEVRHLWLQQAVAEGRFRVAKIAGEHNPADVLTKYKSLGDAKRLLASCNVEVEEVPSGRGKRGSPGEDGWLRLSAGQQWADAEDEEGR